jgi:signal transduction histidine kinase
VDVAAVVASVDGAKVERIVENLVANALRHTEVQAQVWVHAEARDGGVLIRVDDDGPGIPPELQDEVFEPFRQAPGSAAGHSPGVGIGLSLVRRFAELHDGRAWVEDREGGGSSFRVLLPAG